MRKNHTTTVLSIGGNALNNSKNLDNLLEAIYILGKKGNLVITHGNGPQVGELASIEKEPLGLLTAQTDAQIGLFLQEKILKYFSAKGKKCSIETVLTRVLVNKNDKAFKNPSKPIGKFYSKAPSKELAGTYKKLINGYRRIVASPKPLKILDLDLIKALLKERYIVIAAGGGGIPIFYKKGQVVFADAVLDKDYTSALLAKSIDANSFFILTNVDGAYLNYKKKNQIMLKRISATELSLKLRAGYFEEGSMKPKVEAAVDFVKSKKHSVAIGSLKNAKEVIKFKRCTVITP